MPHQILHAVVHKIQKQQNAEATLVTAADPLDPNDPALLDLVEQLSAIYGSRTNKSYGEFDATGATPGIQAEVQELVSQPQADFLELSRRMMAILKGQADLQQFATGGHVLLVDSTNGAVRWFAVAVLSSVTGTAIDEQLHIVRAPHVDLDALRVAGRVNVTLWQKGPGNGRYISFLTGKSKDVSRYFQRFLGCSTVQQDLQDTRQLVKVVKQFSQGQDLSGEARLAMLAKADQFGREAAKSGQPLTLDTFCNYVHPEAPDRLRQALTEADPPIPDGFMVVPRGLEGLKRFVASGPGWKLAFDREQIERKAIRFDPASRTLTICELPPDVLQALNNEFSTQETDDSA